MEEYLKILLEQVRCKKAHPYIADELRSHIEDQAEANVAAGMYQEEAVQEAVRDMGSPIEVGISLDQIHRPQIAWDMIALMAVISIIGIVVHALIGNKANDRNDFALYTIVGFLVMIIVYRMDYSFIGKHSRLIAGLFLGVLVLAIKITDYRVPSTSFMLLYPILFGAVLYQYYGSGIGGILKSLLWMLLPVFLILQAPSKSTAILLFFSMAIVLTLAVCKGWFRVSKKIFFIVFWGIITLAPVLMITGAFGLHWLETYQTIRLQAFFSGSENQNYITNILRSSLSDSQFIGGSGKATIGNLSEFKSNYILSYVTASYGIVASVCVCAILTWLTVKIFHISIKQKNQLGLMMGCGCGVVFFSNIAINILENIGLLPVSQTFLPFFSAGGSDIVVCYVMIGIILSIYRYKSIVPTHVKTCKTV